MTNHHPAAKLEHPRGPQEQVEFRISLVSKGLSGLPCLERPAEVHFSTRLQAEQLFASASVGEVDFTPTLHPSL